MGFCRRCGEIVAGARCQCGGASVAPVVSWDQLRPKDSPQDKWSNTYVSRSRSVSPVRTTPASVPSTSDSPSITSQRTGLQTSPTKRFPRPVSTPNVSSSPTLTSRVHDYIACTTSQNMRPPSPLKHSTLPDPEADILPSLTPYDSTLSKVYGSVLQPKETLTTHSCAICAVPFPPDATIYPDPSHPSDSERYLCKTCFTENGGSKGPCYSCGKPVTTLKSEGGFVHTAGKLWHKRCFTCEGCFKNIGDSPMVDLLGRPSCSDCFDNCLKRGPSTPKKSWASNPNSPRIDHINNLGGMNSNPKGPMSREASPAIEELEQRLGITKSREGSPALEELSQRLSMIGKNIGSRYSTSGASSATSPSMDRQYDRAKSTDVWSGGSPRASTEEQSPVRRYERLRSPELEQVDYALRKTPNRGSGSPSPVRQNKTGSPAPTQEAIEEMKQRLLSNVSKSPSGSPKNITRVSQPSISPSGSRSRRNSTFQPIESLINFSPMIPSTPDLMSDCSDSMTQSSASGCDSPPRTDEEADIFGVSKMFGRGYGSRYTRKDMFDPPEDVITEETASQLGTPNGTPNYKSHKSTPVGTPSDNKSRPTPSPFKSPALKSQAGGNGSPPSDTVTSSSRCAKCEGPLFTVTEGGKYVTIPGENGSSPKTYHNDCFTCAICDGKFREAEKGRAVFVKANGNACHIECAPKERYQIRKTPSSSSMKSSYSNTATSSVLTQTTTIPPSSPERMQSPSVTSSRYEQPSIPINAPFPRFGSRTTCPGCHKAVSPMERGVVPGPQGTRWHASCLVCGGKKETPKGFSFLRGREEKKDKPGCGKKLDSAAKSDGEGGVWCRECLLLLGVGGSPQASPTRTPLVPSHTGSIKVSQQVTGTTTIAKQFTGFGSGGDPSLLRQLTGGGLSPTRSISPTKQMGTSNNGAVPRPRPKSVIGMRNNKSIDEGRGMFLVRQMTGTTATSSSGSVWR